MNEQILSITRKVGAILGTLVTLIGIVPADKWAAFANAIYGAIGAVTAVVGPAMIVGSAVWGWYKASTTAKIAAVNATDGIKVVSTDAAGPIVTRAP